MPADKSSRRLLPFEIRVRKTIQEHGMVQSGDHILVGVSGGADSVALLLCLIKLAPSLQLSLTAAHLNHRIRGSEGDADEEFVRRLSASLQIPFVSESIEVKNQALSSKRNLEEVARQIRYRFLQRAASRVGAAKIAVGHNLNDQAETVLFRFIRGSGIEGLSAIHPVVEDMLIRPLLDCSRRSILEYLKRKRASYREDATNKNLQYARNRIRHELTPYLEKNFNPKLIEALSREAIQARETWSFIEAESQKAFKDLGRKGKEGISLNVKGLRELHPALQKQVLRHGLKECLGSLRGITSRHIHGLQSLCSRERGGGQIRIPGGGIALRQFNTLVLMRQMPQKKPSFIYGLNVPGRCRVAEAGMIFRSVICDTPDLKTIRQKSSTQAFLEPSALPKRLIIRSREPGDRYGGPGHRKVKKLMIDNKIPALQRSELPMVAAGDSVIWIPGFKPARAFAVRPDSETCVLVEMVRDL